MLPELMPNLPGVDTVSTVRHTVLALWFGPSLNRVCTVATLCPALWLSSVLTTQVTAGVNRDIRPPRDSHLLSSLKSLFGLSALGFA